MSSRAPVRRRRSGSPLSAGCAAAVRAAILAVGLVATSAVAQTPDAGTAPPASGAAVPTDASAPPEGTASPAAASNAPPPPASSLSGLAPTGASVRLPELTESVSETLGLSAAAQPGWLLTPQLELQEIYTDNVLQTPSNHRYDFVTEITPSLRINGDTPRVQVNLFYAPIVQIFARTPGQDTVDHQLNGQAIVTLVPELLFLDVRGYATQQPSFGGFAPSGPRTINSNNNILQTSFTVAPYLLHRFGSIGSVELGYAYSATDQTGNSLFQPGGAASPLPSALPPSALLPTFQSGLLTTQEEHLALTSGEILGRTRDRLLLDAIQYSGDQQTGHRNLVLNTIQYAVTRQLGVLVGGGYEDIAFSGTPSVRISDAVWEVGATLTPGPDRSITITYGHRNGFNSPTLELDYAIGARTKLFARYSEDFTSTAQDLQAFVANSGVDRFGNSIDAVTQTPVLTGNALFAINNNLVRQRTFSATLFHQRDRDTALLSIFYQSQSLVATRGVAGYTQEGLTESVTWVHELSPVLSSRATVQYGELTTSGNFAGRTGVFAVDVALIRRLSETTTLTLEGLLTNRSDTLPDNRLVQNLVLIGVRKTFR